jgi:hypothetical protein
MERFKRQCQQKPPSGNLGVRQIVSGPIFSDFSYKNRLEDNFSALEDQF